MSVELKLLRTPADACVDVSLNSKLQEKNKNMGELYAKRSYGVYPVLPPLVSISNRVLVVQNLITTGRSERYERKGKGFHVPRPPYQQQRNFHGIQREGGGGWGRGAEGIRWRRKGYRRSER